jgi:hypothetical protein
MTRSSGTDGWRPMSELPPDGKWRLFTHPDSTVPVIGRPIGPGSDLIENYWRHGVYIVSDRMMWADLP